MNSFTDILTRILDVVGKTDGKKQFIVDFVTIVNMEAMARLIESLPKADQEKVVDLFISIPDGPGKEAAIFGPYFTRERRREVLLEPIREVLLHAEVVAVNRRSMRRIIAMRTKAAAMRRCRSKSRARRRLRLIQPMVRSTIQRFGSTTKRCRSQRRTISSAHAPVRIMAAAIFGPW
jgi:hypothetical protein